MAQGPQLFTCPKCRTTYLGHEPLPDCPRCGYDYREHEGFRWDVLMYLLAIMGLLSFLLVASYYRGNLGVTPRQPAVSPSDGLEKLPGGRSPADSAQAPLPNPFREPAGK